VWQRCEGEPWSTIYVKDECRIDGTEILVMKIANNRKNDHHHHLEGLSYLDRSFLEHEAFHLSRLPALCKTICLGGRRLLFRDSFP
jgi:hypothetical protein